MKDQAKTQKCGNCGQPVLQSDVTCWHCGAKLTLQEIEPHFTAESIEAPVGGPAGSGVPPLQILFYALMTTCISLALLLVIRSLGQQPRLAASFAPEGTPVVELLSPARSFSIEVPPGLVWYFPQDKQGQGDAAEQMAMDPQFEAALQPLFGLTSDGQILLLAQTESGTLTVAQSKQLGQLSVEEVVGSLPEEPFPEGTVLVTKKETNRAGSDVAWITLEQDDPPQLCRQVFLPGSDDAYLAAICAGRDQFNDQSTLIDAILNSLTLR